MDYDISILYHLGKEYMVVDVFSCKAASMGILSYILVSKRPMKLAIQSLANLMARLDISDPARILDYAELRSSLFE